MLVRRRRGWELPERAATPEAVFMARRRLVKGLAAGSILAATSPLVLAGCDDGGSAGAVTASDDPSVGLYPAARNADYTVAREITPEKISGAYNNFYEFGSSKKVQKAAEALPIRPWAVSIEGLVEAPTTIAIDDLLARVSLEERVYRHRCVEAWSMVVPWSGFPLKALVELARPLGDAKYVEFQSFEDPEVAPGQKQFWYSWPYTEGLTIEEATNDLALLVTGIYGKPLPKQFGAPLRLAVPWKYGFKSIKSIQRVVFTDQRPVSFWEEAGPGEYGFWANVNPEVPHPRWSQASERDIGTKEDIPTRLYNGYGEFVAGLYEGLEDEKLYT